MSGASSNLPLPSPKNLMAPLRVGTPRPSFMFKSFLLRFKLSLAASVVVFPESLSTNLPIGLPRILFSNSP